ncbi:MAG: hypothetical protein LBU82_00790 [Treponema sp.]|nr:hypothetical protein [Treponema sp.]
MPAEEVQYNGFVLAGTGEGLFGYDQSGKAISFKGAGGVRKIAKSGEAWAVLGSEGIFVSTDLANWEKRSEGLPVKTIKQYQNGKKSFLPVLQEIKDLKINPFNPGVMVCATKDAVYLSRNQGRHWTNLGAPPYRTNGIKAAAVCDLPSADGLQLTVFMSHSVYGTYYIQPDKKGSVWTEISAGLEKLESTDNADEVSDFAVIATEGGGAEIYAAQTFRCRIYRLDWENKTFNLAWTDNSSFGTVDSLSAGKGCLRFLIEGSAAEINFQALMAGARPPIRPRVDLTAEIRLIESVLNQKLNCAAMLDKNRRNELAIFNELWLVTGGAQNNNCVTEDREGIYLPVHHAKDSRLNRYYALLSGQNLNMVVIDMKDDYGRLHFTPKNPAITSKGRVFNPLDIDALLKDFKARGIYAVARVVVFKDPVLAAKENGKYAVWDGRTNKPWAGYYDKKQPKGTGVPEGSPLTMTVLPSKEPDSEILRALYDERWVDPFSEEVWDYAADVASELYERGFDEIQFDYIRFPTDGANLGDAVFRWQDGGMDRESAILSFLRHIRSRVKAPISIDIYGANGWYRTGSRTGQEVELMAPWVDVICPMYYPSHFEQDFLAQTPAELRPWRIYYYGTLRTARIGRGQVLVRPYVQAFSLNVSYDRKYYNAEYVRKEVTGVRDAGRGGFTYWNNLGRYDDIPPPDNAR